MGARRVGVAESSLVPYRDTQGSLGGSTEEKSSVARVEDAIE